MDRSECKAIVERHAQKMAEDIGVSHWKISIQYEPMGIDGDWQDLGRCQMFHQYDRALITLNHEAFDDEKEVLSVLRHELLHIVIAPMEVYFDAVVPLIENDPVRDSIFAGLRRQALEQIVINLERMHNNLTPPESPAVAKKTATPAVPKAPTKAAPARAPKPPVPAKPVKPAPKVAARKGK